MNDQPNPADVVRPDWVTGKLGEATVVDLTGGHLPAVPTQVERPTHTPAPRVTPPQPGSYDALAAGCTCPVIQSDNGLVTGGCPVHAPRLT